MKPTDPEQPSSQDPSSADSGHPETDADSRDVGAQASSAQEPSPDAENSPHGSRRWRVLLPRPLQRTDPDQIVDDVKPTPTRRLPGDTDDVTLIAFEQRRLRRSVITVLLLVAAGMLTLWLFGVLGHFLFLLLLAWLIAIGMEPSIGFFAKRGWRRGFGTAVTLLGLVIGFIAFLAAFGGLLFSQVAELLQSLPNVVTDVVRWLNDTFNLDLNPNQVVNQLNLDASTIANFASDLAGGVVGVLTGVLGLVFDFLTVLVFAFYIAADGPRLRRYIASWMPPTRQLVFQEVWNISLVKTGGFVVSKFILGGLSAIAHSIFFAIIDVPYWLPLGIFAGLTSQFIPTIGTYIGVAVPMLFAAVSDPIDAVYIAGFATIYQQVENYVFTPRVSRATMDIHPAVALGSVFVGAAIFGPIGALIGIPMAAAIIAVIDTYTSRYEVIPELGGATSRNPK